MEITIYQVDSDVNRYAHFCDTRRLAFAELFPQMCEGLSLISKWEPATVELVEGRVGDFAGGPVHFADISVSESALDRVRQLVDFVCELLPFSYEQRKYSALYIPWPTDCLDWEKSSFYFDRRTIEDLRDVAFELEKLPRKQGLFRLPSRFQYYCTQEFKDAIEDAGLTGLSFRFVWSSDGSVPKERKPSAKTKAKVKEELVLKVNRRPTKRDLLLERLWEAIDSFGSEEWLNSMLSVKASDLKGVQDVIASDTEVLKAAAKLGVAKQDLQRLCRSVAYKAIFEAFVAIEEECLDRSPALKGLHEDLLMADPSK